MIGHSTGAPIVLAPPNDLLGLAITEGIEDGLSTSESTGLGVWAAGSASRMPALADSVPTYIEVCAVVVDDDPDGRRQGAELGSRIRSRGIETNLIVPNTSRFAA
jgi:Toprim domain